MDLGFCCLRLNVCCLVVWMWNLGFCGWYKSGFGGNWYFRGMVCLGSGFVVFGVLILLSVCLRLGFDVW